MCNASTHPPGCACVWGPSWNHVSGGYDYQNKDKQFLRNLNDFTRSTRCHYCNKPVYFVRHNGESVWFDELGQPWPKHPCYYEPINLSRGEAQATKAIETWIHRLRRPFVGVVIDATVDKATQAKYLHLHCTDDKVRQVRVYVTFSLEGSIGEFVIYSNEDGQLVRPYLNTETTLALQPPPLIEPAKRKSQRIKRFINPDEVTTFKDVERKVSLQQREAQQKQRTEQANRNNPSSSNFLRLAEARQQQTKKRRP